MVEIVFYEKPGCINNTRQKQLLAQAGHHVHSRNLLTETWSREKLLDYFDGMSVTMWFNTSAPDIKSGKVDPSELSEEQALDLMIDNPLLIRRPLMRVANEHWVGFEPRMVHEWIGLAQVNPDADLETCPQSASQVCAMPSGNP